MGNMHVDSEKIWVATVALIQSDIPDAEWGDVIFKTNDEAEVWPELRQGAKDMHLPCLPEEKEDTKSKKARTSQAQDPLQAHDPWGGKGQTSKGADSRGQRSQKTEGPAKWEEDSSWGHDQQSGSGSGHAGAWGSSEKHSGKGKSKGKGWGRPGWSSQGSSGHKDSGWGGDRHGAWDEGAWEEW